MWTDHGVPHERIQVAKMDGSSRKTLTSRLDNPKLEGSTSEYCVVLQSLVLSLEQETLERKR